MFTRCPQCSTTFRVSAEDLRVAGGDVRCGECETIFSALEYLSAAPDKTAADADVMAFEQAVEAAIVETEDDSVPEAPQAETETEAAPEDTVSGKPAFRPVAERADNEIYFSTTIIELDAVGEPPDTQPAPEAVEPGDIELPAPVPAIAARAGNPDELFGGRRQTHPQRFAWSTAAVALGLVLAAQFVHEFREQLVEDARFGNAIAGFYQRIGNPVIQPAEPGDYQIVKRGAFTNLDDRRSLRIRASIGNRSDESQPYPLMRLELTDRWGDIVGRRDFSAKEYLVDTETGNKRLEPKQTVRAEVTILDPGENATNFELDVCVKKTNGDVRCADDVSET